MVDKSEKVAEKTGKQDEFHMADQYMHLLYAYKGYKQCEEYKNKLEDCREGLKDEHKDVLQCKNEAVAYLECFDRLVQNGKTHCQVEYKKAHDCLKESKPKKWVEAPQGVCKGLIDAFVDCKYE